MFRKFFGIHALTRRNANLSQDVCDWKNWKGKSRKRCKKNSLQMFKHGLGSAHHRRDWIYFLKKILKYIRIQEYMLTAILKLKKEQMHTENHAIKLKKSATCVTAKWAKLSKSMQHLDNFDETIKTNNSHVNFPRGLEAVDWSTQKAESKVGSCKSKCSLLAI